MTHFTPVHPKVPAEVRSLEVTLKWRAATGEEAESKSINYRVELVDNDGRPVRCTQDAGNLLPHMTSQQISGQNGFIDDMLALSQQMIPTP